jgi:hypothetical protein
MAVTIAEPIASTRENGPFPRPISSNILVAPSLVGRSGMTASRPAGVGRPTASPDPSAPPDGGDPPSSDPLPLPQLVQEAVDTALDSIGMLEAQARDAARRFRRGPLDDAQRRLAALVESTRTLIELAVMAAESSGTSLEALGTACGEQPEQQTQTALLRMIDRQIEGDWHGLAGALEGSYVAALGAWRRIFEALDGPDPMGTAA